MIKKFLFVEDGSICVDELQQSLDDAGMDTIKIVVYRQGANRPELEDIYKIDPTSKQDMKELIEQTKSETTRQILDEVKRFISDRCRSDVEVYNECTAQWERKITFKGTVYDFMKELSDRLK